MDFAGFFMKHWPEIVSGTLAICAAITGLVGAINARRFMKYLDKAKERETYAVCPHCKKRIPLSEIQFHLPTGEVDNNLNGKPDEDE